MLWQEYTHGKQTYAQLSLKYSCSQRTIQRKLDTVKTEQSTIFLGITNLLIDTSYFGRKFGVMVFKDAITGQVLLKRYVHHETNKLYYEGVEEIARRGIKIQSIICDGGKGLLDLFGNNTPVQMCNFHQVAIVRRYLTKKPKMQCRHKKYLSFSCERHRVNHLKANCLVWAITSLFLGRSVS
jgi:hypothetical protein